MTTVSRSRLVHLIADEIPTEKFAAASRRLILSPRQQPRLHVPADPKSKDDPHTPASIPASIFYGLPRSAEPTRGRPKAVPCRLRSWQSYGKRTGPTTFAPSSFGKEAETSRREHNRACPRKVLAQPLHNLADWMPDDEAVFGFLLQMMIGPKDADSFDVLVCSPASLAQEMASTGIRSGEHMLFMSRYEYPLLLRYIERHVQSCEALTWPDLAKTLGRIGRWEFDGCRSPSPSTAEA